MREPCHCQQPSSRYCQEDQTSSHAPSTSSVPAATASCRSNQPCFKITKRAKPRKVPQCGRGAVIDTEFKARKSEIHSCLYKSTRNQKRKKIFMTGLGDSFGFSFAALESNSGIEKEGKKEATSVCIENMILYLVGELVLWGLEAGTQLYFRHFCFFAFFFFLFFTVSIL